MKETILSYLKNRPYALLLVIVIVNAFLDPKSGGYDKAGTLYIIIRQALWIY